MLYWLTEFSDGGDFFNLFRYITFRAGGAFFTAGLRGHGAGWELMALYTLPSVGAAFIGLVIRRSAITWIGVVFAVISVVSFFLGA